MGIFNKYKFEIPIPKNLSQEWFKDKVRFVGDKNDIYIFAKEFRKLKELKDGDLVKLGKLTLKVSDYITEDRNKENWIELPNHAWGILSSKFYDVWEGYDENPFDFNDCGYTNKNPFDIGIEITDMPFTDEVILEKPHVRLLKSEWDELYLLISDTEIFDFVEDWLIEKCNIDIKYHQESEIDNIRKYRLHLSPNDEPKVLKELEKIDNKELERIWELNN